MTEERSRAGGHLAQEEFVDLVDGVLPQARAAHAAGCARCRAQADAMRSVLAEARQADEPDPSPLFWQHFPSRVWAALETAQPAASRRPWYVRPVVAATAAVALAATALVLWRAPASRPATPPRDVVGRLSPALQNGALGLADIEADEAWGLVRSVAEDAPWDEAHEAAFGERPGAADRIALELSEREQAELARLLHDELSRRDWRRLM